MFSTRAIEDTLDAVDVAISPFFVRLTDDLYQRKSAGDNKGIGLFSLTYLSNIANKDDESSRNNGFFVHNIELLRDGGGEQTGTQDDSSGLGDDARRRRHFINNSGGTLGGGLLVGSHRASRDLFGFFSWMENI